MSVVCAIPVQIPVHRVRATVRCRELGTPLHTTVRRLTEQAGADEQLIAAVTGAPLGRIAEVLGELSHRLAPIEREYLIWVDHARERCLPYSSLDGVVVVRRRDGGLTLPVDPPTPASLARMGLSAAASWDSGVDGHVEIEEVLDVLADVRGGPPSRTGRLSHVLCLPDVHLVVSVSEGQPRIALTQHGLESPELTRWLHEQYGPSLQDILNVEHLIREGAPPQALTELTGPEPLGWESIEPHPELLRRALIDVAEAAEDRLDICAPSLREIPEWLREALEDALARGVSVVVHPADAKDAPRRLETLVAVLPEQPDTLCAIADTTRALLHSDPRASLDRGEDRSPHRQYVLATRDQGTVRALLKRLALHPPQRRKPSEKLGAQTIKRMLETALAALVDELPSGVTASIEPEDESFAAATLDRYHRRGDSPTDGMLAVAAGIAWERVVIATATHLCEQHDQLEFLASRWSPPQGRIDLDVIVADHAKHVVWVIDAKNRTPTNEQEGTMLHQLRVLADHPETTPTDWTAIGLIVHPLRHLRISPRQSEQPSILRCNLQDLSRLLSIETLPDRRVV
ncbi:MAG TPA: hypothetical protein VGN25_05215 [Solirubrobacteraceae bacterium]|nr:hypothetical protein [Solirubrobacteraceae bacterium]